jgi:hypothetical protein
VCYEEQGDGPYIQRVVEYVPGLVRPYVGNCEGVAFVKTPDGRVPLREGDFICLWSDGSFSTTRDRAMIGMVRNEDDGEKE